MLENYFSQPATVDRYLHSWVGAEIEQYVVWLAGNHYSDSCVWRRVPLLFAFGEFVCARGAAAVAELPGHVDAFVDDRVALHHKRTGSSRSMAEEIRGPVEQMLTVVLPGYEPGGRQRLELPFADTVPGFFEYLTHERGLRPLTVGSYRIHLRKFEAYLQQVGMESIQALSPALISA